MKIKESAQLLAVTLAVGCAVITTALAIRREFFPGAGRGAPPQVRQAPVNVADWKDYAVGGHLMGSGDAPVTIIEFADFECPYCRSFASGALAMVRRKYAQKVSVLFREWPLEGHRMAYPAARAAECAAEQGRFVFFHDAIYSKQDSLGLKPFKDFAAEAGVPDLEKFVRCNSKPGTVEVIERDIAAAKRLGATGTPTIIVNGLLLPGTPDSLSLERYIQRALSSKQ